MKKLIIALTCAAVLSACSSDGDKQLKRQAGALDKISSDDYKGPFSTIKIVEIDSCEYVITKDGYSGGVCHKGNCKNPIHWKVIAKEVN